jgi:hypothetical protein
MLKYMLVLGGSKMEIVFDKKCPIYGNNKMI